MRKMAIRLLRRLADRLERAEKRKYTRPNVNPCGACGHEKAEHSDVGDCYGRVGNLLCMCGAFQDGVR